MRGTTWDAYRAQHVPHDAPPGFLRWLRVATCDGKYTAEHFGSTAGVLALLAAWQAGADARSTQEATWLAK